MGVAGIHREVMMSVGRQIRLAVLALLTLGATAVAVTTPAAAAVSTGHRATLAHAPMQPTPPGTTPLLAPAGTTTSTNWSGFAAHGSTYSSVSAAWVVSPLTCTTGQKFSSSWVGLDGYNSSTVEQTGTESDCSGITPSYGAWYEMFPAGSVGIAKPVSAGDHMSASVTSAGTSFTLTISDGTKGWTHTVTKTSATAKRSSAEAIEEAPCCTSGGGILPLANFGTVPFTLVHVDGPLIGASNPTRINMVSTGGVTKATTSTLNPAGGAFSVTWHHS